MKTKDRQIGWHLFLVVVVFLLLMPIVFAISNSFKTMQEAFNTVFQVIPLHPTLECSCTVRKQATENKR